MKRDIIPHLADQTTIQEENVSAEVDVEEVVDLTSAPVDILDYFEELPVEEPLLNKDAAILSYNRAESSIPIVNDIHEQGISYSSNYSNQDCTNSASQALIRYDPLESYLNEIRHIPKLTKEEERELSVRYREKNDVAAGYRLVMANLRLVVRIAREYRNTLRNLLDIIQEGNLGLMHAVNQFDPYKGVRFPSYAVYWIRAYILRYLINNMRLVKIGTTQVQRKLFFNLQKEKANLEAAGFYPEAALLAQRLEVKESEVVEMQQRLALPDLSVDAPVNRDGDSGDYHDILPGHGYNAEQMVSELQFTEKLRSAVEEFKSRINDKEKAIVDLRLFTDEPKTLQELADMFEISRERIRQLETRVKKQLREYFTEEIGISPDTDWYNALI